MPKTVLPELGLHSFSCPHCGALAHQDWFRILPKSFERNNSPEFFTIEDVNLDKVKNIEDIDERRRTLDFVERLKKNDVAVRVHQWTQDTHWELHNIFGSLCHSCSGWALWVKDNIVYPATSFEIIAHEDLPNELRDDFEEAAKIVDISPRGSAALLRLCIQKLMPLLDEKGTNLNDDIASLVKKGLDVNVQRALDVVRVIGNNAVHPGQIDLKDDKVIAVKLFGLLDLIVERMISTPKKLGEIFNGLPEAALKAIENRDAPKAVEDKSGQ